MFRTPCDIGGSPGLFPGKQPVPRQDSTAFVYDGRMVRCNDGCDVVRPEVQAGKVGEVLPYRGFFRIKRKRKDIFAVIGGDLHFLQDSVTGNVVKQEAFTDLRQFQ